MHAWCALASVLVDAACNKHVACYYDSAKLVMNTCHVICGRFVYDYIDLFTTGGTPPSQLHTVLAAQFIRQHKVDSRYEGTAPCLHVYGPSTPPGALLAAALPGLCLCLIKCMIEVSGRSHSCIGCSVSPFCGLTTWRHAVYAFIAGLDVSYVFKCPVCQDCPEVVIGDATMLTLRKEKYSGTPITQPNTSVPQIPAPGHRRHNRCFQPDTSARQTLGALAQYVRGSGGRGQRDPLPGDWAPSQISMPGRPRVQGALCAIADMAGPGKPPATALPPRGAGAALTASDRASVARFLDSLASDSPVLSYVPIAAAAVLRDAVQPAQSVLAAPASAALAATTFSVEQLDCLALHAPVLYAVVRLLCTRLRGFNLRDATWSALFTLLADLSEGCVTSSARGDGRGAADPLDVAVCNPQQQPSCSSSACLHEGVCEGLGRVRWRAQCSADASTALRLDDAHHADREPPRGSGSCNHGFHATGARTGGVFTWFCQHGVCYGFYIIPNAEGRNEAFSFLTCFFKHAPRVVVYDFACSLQEYCLNRAPAFFKDTLFLVDKFHWNNHTACSYGYCMELYDRWRMLNSQIAEQCNSALRKIKSALSMMRQDNYMTALRLYLHAWNEGKLAVLRAHEEHRSCL